MIDSIFFNDEAAADLCLNTVDEHFWNGCNYALEQETDVAYDDLSNHFEFPLEERLLLSPAIR